MVFLLPAVKESLVEVFLCHSLCYTTVSSYKKSASVPANTTNYLYVNCHLSDVLIWSALHVQVIYILYNNIISIFVHNT